jgi:hypothetical protein
MSVSLSLFAGAGWQFFTDSGTVLSGGLVYTYAAGTTTPVTTYSSVTGLTANSNPIVLNSAGRVAGEVWLTDGVGYKFVVKTSTGVTIGTYDNIYSADSSSVDALALLAASSGSSLVGFINSGTGATARTVQAKLRESVSVKDFGATGDGVTDDTAAIQAAIDSGAKKVIFPLGAYKTNALTLQSWTQLVGETMPLGVGAGDGPVRLLFNLASGVALTCSDNPVIQNITFKNTAGTYNETTATLSGTTASAIKTNGNAVIENCNFYYWYECINLAGSCYYFKSSNVEFARCTVGYSANTVTPYDVQIVGPISRLTDTFFSGTASYLPRNVKVFGGSIEGYSKVALYFSDISFFGTYFETQSPRSSVIAIEPGANNSSVSLFGCLVYLNLTARFVNMSGFTGCMLSSSGNVFDGVGPASSYVFYLPSSGTVNLAGDRFGSGHANDCRYVDSLSFAGSQNIVFPSLPAANVQAAYGGVTYLGNRGYSMTVLTAAPTSPISGMTVLADGTSWDPLSRAYGRPYWVTWQGDRWRTPGGLT